MKWNKKIPGFSTVESIVASVILSIVILVIYSTINHAIESQHILTITRGVEVYQKWSDNLYSTESPVGNLPLKFNGGKVLIDCKNHAEFAGLYHVKITINDLNERKVISWEELKYLP